MSLEIIFTDDATEMLVSIADFIESKWSSRQVDKFLEKTYKILDLVADHPYMFKASIIKENVRIGIITKQTSFFYEVQENQIIILFFWDNRQDPIFIL